MKQTESLLNLHLPLAYSGKKQSPHSMMSAIMGRTSRGPEKYLACTWGQGRPYPPVTSKLRDKLQLDEDYFRQMTPPQKSRDEIEHKYIKVLQDIRNG